MFLLIDGHYLVAELRRGSFTDSLYHTCRRNTSPAFTTLLTIHPNGGLSFLLSDHLFLLPKLAHQSPVAHHTRSLGLL